MEELFGKAQGANLVGRPTGPDNRVELSANELGNEMVRLLDNPGVREQLGQNAYVVSQRFLWAAVAGRFEKAYYSSLGRSLEIEPLSGAAL